MNSERLRLPGLGGMREVYIQRPGDADYINDMRLDQLGAWSEAPGFAWISKRARRGDPTENAWDLSGVDDIPTMFWWSQHNGARQWLMWEESYIDTGVKYSRLMHFDPREAVLGRRSVVSEKRSYKPGPWQRTQYMANAGWLYFVNGVDQPTRWNGTRSERIGFDRRPPAPEVRGPDYDDVGSLGLVLIDETPAFDNAYSAGAGVNDPRQRGLGDQPEAPGAAVVYFEWLYGWAVTFVNELGMESPPSDIRYLQGRNAAVSSGTLTLDVHGKTYAVINIPQAPANIRAIRLWRTDNVYGVDGDSLRGQKLFLHSEYPSSLGGVIADGKPDRELGRALDDSTLGLWPTGVKYLSMFKGTLFISGMAEAPDQVSYSAPGFIEQIPPANFFYLGDRSSGEITGLRATKNALVIWKRRGIYLIKGDPLSGFYAETLTEDVGSASPNAIAEIPGAGLAFLSEEGPMLLAGALENTGTPTSVIPLGKDIQRTWRNKVSTASLMSAQAVLHHAERELWFQLCSLGSEKPNLGLVYHYEQQAWSIREDWPVNSMVESADHRGYLFIGCYAPTKNQRHGSALTPSAEVVTGVHVVSHGWRDHCYIAKNPLYRTGWIHMGGEAERSLLQHVEYYGLSHGNRQVRMRWKRDQREVYEAQELTLNAEDAERKDSVNGNTPPPKWGSATWSATELYTEYHPILVSFATDQENAGLQHQVEYSGVNVEPVGDSDLGRPPKLTIINGGFVVARGNRGEDIRVLSNNTTTEVR